LLTEAALGQCGFVPAQADCAGRFGLQV